MFSTITTYIRQRFNPALYTMLAAFLMLYANGVEWTLRGAVVSFAFALATLFWFRMFDDVASGAVDQGKPDRIYTEADARRRLSMLLVPFAVILLVATAVVDTQAAAILGAYIIVQIIAYRMLFEREVWRRVLPLLKYPVLATTLYMLVHDAGMLTLSSALSFAALLPIFIAFEIVDDESFVVKWWLLPFVLVVAHALMLTSVSPPELINYVMFAASGASSPVAIVLLVFVATCAILALGVLDGIRAKAHPTTDRRFVFAQYALLLYFIGLRLLVFLDHAV
ncbi:MAG: hypothetical protein H7X80_07485 [bacterium]|nr:hypothetical protein [Candidatus Kapabacteria bacterium]